MPQQAVNSGRSAQRQSAPAPHVNHLRTHHTTPSRSRGSVVSAPVGARWRNPELARAAMFELAVV